MAKPNRYDPWQYTEEEKKNLAEKYPTTEDCLAAIAEINSRLVNLGWNNAIYCPKDGTRFEAIEFGCTAILDCWYDGEWPDGCWWVADDNDIAIGRPVLFRLRHQHGWISFKDYEPRHGRMIMCLSQNDVCVVRYNDIKQPSWEYWRPLMLSPDDKVYKLPTARKCWAEINSLPTD